MDYHVLTDLKGLLYFVKGNCQNVLIPFWKGFTRVEPFTAGDLCLYENKESKSYLLCKNNLPSVSRLLQFT